MIVHVCQRSAERVELLGAGAILLDLGACTADEARSLVGNLLSYLDARGVAAEAGIGPTGIVAHLALQLGWISGRPVPLVPNGERSAFLCSVPARLIPELYPRGIINLDLVARLDHYGLHTLGQIARLEKLALCRQFGMAAGTFLAAVAAGDDPQPFSPTSGATRHSLRLHFVTPASPPRLLEALPYLSRSAAALLERHQVLVHCLRIRLRWVEGGGEQANKVLRQPTADSRILAQELNRMVLLLLTGHSAGRACGAGEIEELQLFLEMEIPARSEQKSLWPDQTQAVQPTNQQRREQKLAALQTISTTLARRYGRLPCAQPLLFHHCLTYPDAIFSEERYSKAGIS
ncbi:MAG: hypothetical protein ACLQUY_12460 [Ktedonobacterales bacterium]